MAGVFLLPGLSPRFPKLGQDPQENAGGKRHGDVPGVVVLDGVGGCLPEENHDDVCGVDVKAVAAQQVSWPKVQQVRPLADNPADTHDEQEEVCKAEGAYVFPADEKIRGLWQRYELVGPEKAEDQQD